MVRAFAVRDDNANSIDQCNSCLPERPRTYKVTLSVNMVYMIDYLMSDRLSDVCKTLEVIDKRYQTRFLRDFAVRDDNANSILPTQKAPRTYKATISVNTVSMIDYLMSKRHLKLDKRYRNRFLNGYMYMDFAIRDGNYNSLRHRTSYLVEIYVDGE